MLKPSRLGIAVPILALAVVLVTAAGAATSAPKNTALPTISGSPVVGATLTATHGTWSGSPTKYAYSWRRCTSSGASCSAISKATTTKYVVKSADANHRLRVVVTASNARGSTAAKSALTATVKAKSTPPPADKTPPSAPSSVHSTSATQSSITIAWTGSTDNVGVTGYRVYADGAVAGTTAGTSYTVGSYTCGTTHSFAVVAYDAAGNTSSQSTASASTSACSSTPPPPSDTTPPSAPSSVHSSSATQSSITIAWTGSTDNVGVTGYRVYADGGVAGTTSGTSYTVSSFTCGTTHSFSVVAYDAAGNTSAQSSSVSASTSACSTPPPTSTGLHVSGNKLLDANNNVVQLHGVNYSGTEYACIQGWGIFDGPSDANMVKAIASWHSNIVHIGLNEDCILGINGVASQYAGSNYMNAITSFVNLLHQNGLYAEVSLMWAAPGTQKALDHPQILDQDHAPAALQAIANAFKNDPKTIIGLQSEPHDITYACWLNGGSSCSVGYTALGMQGALNAVRSTGATNVVTASGIDYANNLSGWLQNKPNDPNGQLMAEAHVYGGNSCASTSCFNTNYAPVAAQVPMVFGETGETYDSSSCSSTNTSTFMNWADSHGVGYEAWVWDTWGDCGSLISNFDGTPANAYAQFVHDHYVSKF